MASNMSRMNRRQGHKGNKRNAKGQLAWKLRDQQYRETIKANRKAKAERRAEQGEQ